MDNFLDKSKELVEIEKKTSSFMERVKKDSMLREKIAREIAKVLLQGDKTIYPILREVQKRLQREGIFSSLMDDYKKDCNGYALTDRQLETEAMEWATVILHVEGKRPGTTTENTILSNCPELIGKTTYFVLGENDYKKLFNVKNGRRIHQHSIVPCKDEKTLIEAMVFCAKKECYRLADTKKNENHNKGEK